MDRHAFHNHHRFFHHHHGFFSFYPYYGSYYPYFDYYYPDYCDPYSPYYDPDYCYWLKYGYYPGDPAGLYSYRDANRVSSLTPEPLWRNAFPTSDRRIAVEASGTPGEEGQELTLHTSAAQRAGATAAAPPQSEEQKIGANRIPEAMAVGAPLVSAPEAPEALPAEGGEAK